MSTEESGGYPKLKPEIKTQWIAELASSRWIKDFDFLGVPETKQRCCLGVLCEVVGKPLTGEDEDLAYPSDAVTELAFLGGNTALTVKDVYYKLSELNDDFQEGWDVYVIPWIEENL